MIERKIIAWYLENKRELPWRGSRDPYTIWVSEIILQQTRVAQGLSYFEKFIDKFPTVRDLAAAGEEEVLRLWQGLGYYSRGRNLHKAAQYVVNELNGEFPKTYADLIRLKGVGKYTAAAIASIAYKEVVPAIDGNVIRVISRLMKILTPVDEPTGLKEVQKFSDLLVSREYPDVYNQAMMELGALVCTPKNPKCDICPVQTFCLSFPDKSYLQIPVKSKKIKIETIKINYLVLRNDKDEILLKQRSDKGIWANLFDFPEISDGESVEWEKLLKPGEIIHFPTVSVLLTHRKLEICFILFEIGGEYTFNLNGNWYGLKDLSRLAKPKPVVDFLNRVITSPFEEF